MNPSHMNLHIHRGTYSSRILRLACLALGLLLSTHLAAQNPASSLLILSTVDAEVSVDGEAGVRVLANKAQKFPVAVGEHYIVAQAQVNADTLELSQTVTTVAGAQKLVKLDFAKAPVPPKPAAAAVGDTSGAAASILVAELDFNMPSSLVQTAWKAKYPGYNYPHNPGYYVAFEKGDVVSFDFSMINMFGTNVIVVKTLEDDKVVYSNGGFSALKDVRFTVPERAIYHFSLATNAALDRTGKLVIRRTPLSPETAVFDTKPIFKATYKAKVIEAPRTIYVSSDSPAVAKGPKPRATLPLICPPGTVAWYYAYSVCDDTSQASQVKARMGLEKQISEALASHTLNAAPQLDAAKLSAPSGTRTCDVFFLDRANASLFGSKGTFKSLPAGTKENLSAGVVQVKCCMDDNYYLGLRPTKGQGPVAVVVEVVAIVSESSWLMAE